MKKQIILTAIMLTLFGKIFSQEVIFDTTFIVKNNKINIIESRDDIKIKVYRYKSNEQTPIYPYYESYYEIDNNEYVNENRNITVHIPTVSSPMRRKKEIIYSKTTGEKPKISCFYPTYPSLYYSYTQIYDSPFDFTSSLFKQRPVSFEWGSYPFTQEVCSNKSNTLGLTVALGISNTYNYLSNNTVLCTYNDNTYLYNFTDEENIIPEGLEDKENVDKSFIRYWSIRMPISVQLQCRLGYKKIALSVGPEFEYRFAMRSIARYDGSKHIISDDINYNPLAMNALGIISFDEVSVIGRFGLTQMFRNDYNAFPFSIGVGFVL